MRKRGDYTRAERRAMRPPFAYPRLRRFAIGLGVLVVAWLGWTGVHIWQVTSHLDHAQSLLDEAQAGLSARDLTAARTVLAKAGKDTHAARDAANGIVWRLTAHVPVIGRSFDAVSVLTKSADAVARVALPPAIDAAKGLDGKQLRKPDGSIDLAKITAAQPALTKSVQQLQKQLAISTKTHRGLWFVSSHRRDYLIQLTKITDQLGKALQVSKTLPAMLGGDGSRHYFMGFLTNAEARGAGGFLGSYAILDVDHGKLHFRRFGDHSDLHDATSPVVDLGNEFNDDYQNLQPASSWTASTSTPDFPSVGRIWLGLWKAQFGETLDGAIETDPVGLSFMLQATGPVTADNGEVITSDNVVAKLENEAYVRYGDGDQLPRKAYLLDVAAKSSQALLAAHDEAAVFSAIQNAATDHRLRVYMARKEEQSSVMDTAVSGQLPDPGRPLAYLVVQNFAGNKMEYYLKREVTYHQSGCGRRPYIEVTLTNTLSPKAAAALPEYVAGRAPDAAYTKAPKGSNFLSVTVYIDSGTGLQEVLLDNRTTHLRTFVEKDLIAASTVLTIAPGAKRQLTIVLTNEASGAPRVPVQPLVLPQVTTILPPACR